MSAIRPNKNFDNEHKEHVPYKQITPASMMARYTELMKAPETGRHRAPAIKNKQVYQRWFNKDSEWKQSY